MGNFNFQNYIANKRKDRREERVFLRHCIGSGISGSALARMKYRMRDRSIIFNLYIARMVIDLGLELMLEDKTESVDILAHLLFP